jgi:hypothetical protein
MALNQIVLLSLVNLIFSCYATSQDARGSTIVITSNPSNNNWWLAYAVSDTATTAVELQDSGAYASWTSLSASNWGYWIFTTSGSPITFPVSFRLSAGSEKLIIKNAFSTNAPGVSIDTKTLFSGSSSDLPTQAPTTKPTPTQTPTTAPTQTPTKAPTQAPTQAPTKAPTTAPTQAPTKAPTQAPTQAPTKAPTQAPTKAPTQAPTKAPTQAPTKAPTKAPTQAPTKGGNPFDGTEYYINPHYTFEVDSSIATNPSLSATLAKVKAFASAFWIDRMAVIDTRDFISKGKAVKILPLRFGRSAVKQTNFRTSIKNSGKVIFFL